jgi:LuxR family maltose regulon positive regulatory protein
MYAAGRSETLMEWLDWVAERGGVPARPVIAALAAYVCALTGRPAAADRWADLAEHCAGGPGAPGEDRYFAMWLTSLRGLMCRNGVEQMRRDVDAFAGGGSVADSEYPARLVLSGIANLHLGDDETAEDRFRDASELLDGTGRVPLLSTALAHHALLSLGRGDWETTAALVEQALSVTRRGHCEARVTSALVFALAARVALYRGDPPAARAHLADGRRLRPLLTHAVPFLAVEALLELAEASLGLADPAGAAVLVRDAEAVLRRRPDLGALGTRTDELRQRLGSRRVAGSDTGTLTSAELRVLPLLLTHLTLAGIADRLGLSRHTVKTQVWSMYHKLGAHTRDQAVFRARELGLLEA